MPGIQPPAVDTHPQREKIIEALLAGESPQSISKWCNPRINHVSIWRYRRNRVEPKLAEVDKTAKALHEHVLQAARENSHVDQSIIQAATRAAVEADPLLARQLAKYARYDIAIPQALEAKDFMAFAALDRAETAAMRFHAELTGRLQQSAPTTLVQIVVGSESRENPVERADDAPGETIDIQPVRE